jgi:hypothetical protein
MFRSSWLKAVVVPLAALVVVLAVSQTADAQVKPFKIVGEGVGPLGLPLPGQEPRPHWIVGNATHLGKHTGAGTVQTDTAQLNPDGTITGEFGSGSPFVFKGANGDKLVCHYGRTDFGASEPGTFQLTILDVSPTGELLVEALWIAEFVPQPALCTGKFAGVTGGWVMYARSEPFVLGSDDPVYYSWQGEGTLEFRKGKR